MGILDNIIGRSPFLSGTQQMFGQQPMQMPVPQQQQPQFVAPQVAPRQQPQQQNGPDLSMIMKIMSMFGGA